MTSAEWNTARREFWERRFEIHKTPGSLVDGAAIVASQELAEWEKAFPRPAEDASQTHRCCLRCDRWNENCIYGETSPNVGVNQPRRYLVEVVDRKDENHGLVSTWLGESVGIGVAKGSNAFSVKELPPMPSVSELVVRNAPWTVNGARVDELICRVLRACGLEPRE